MHYYALCVNKIPVGVLGASGYAGRELCALIEGHPRLALAFATANEQRGTTVRVRGRELTYVSNDDAPLGQAELVFSALPHGASKDWVERVRGKATGRVRDLIGGSGHWLRGIGDPSASGQTATPNSS